MTTHTTPPLAQQLRSLAASAPTLHRPALAAAADAVEECARLRAERDEARDQITDANVALQIALGDGITGMLRARIECLQDARDVIEEKFDWSRTLLAEAHERIVSLHGCFPPDHKRGSEAEKSIRVLSRINNLLMQEVVK